MFNDVDGVGYAGRPGVKVDNSADCGLPDRCGLCSSHDLCAGWESVHCVVISVVMGNGDKIDVE